MTGAQALVEALKREGVEVIFGLPGGANLPLYDALYHTPEIRHILVRHEQGAAHMADGYARATGKVGVCLATSGPGATNLVTGIANAYMDSIPIVALTGQVATWAVGTDAFQEADITGITMPIVKHSYLVKDPAQIPEVVQEAFYIARTGRPGPVLIDLPKDVLAAEGNFSSGNGHRLRGYRPIYKGQVRQILQAVEILQRAERPVLYIGGGTIWADASEEIRALAERAHLPVINSLMAKGVFPETHPQSLGMPGMHGSVYANYALNFCDVLIGIGTRFDDRVTGKVSEFAKLAAIIHIDIDPAELGKVVKTAVSIVGNVKDVLQEMLPYVPPLRFERWWEQVEEWRRLYPYRYRAKHPLPPQYVIEQIYEATQGEAIVTTGVGQHQMWAAQYYRFRRPRQWITSGGLGTMGFALPAAIGAAVGRPGERVVAIEGDGGFQMTNQELTTAVRLGLPILVAIINNQALGMVKQWQKLFFGRRYIGIDLSDNPDFAKLAEAHGAVGMRVTRAEEVRPALERALEIQGPVVIDFLVDPEADVYPMIPAGKTVHDIIIEEPEAQEA